MDVEATIDFLKAVEAFKTCERTCHTTRAGRAESDAEHTWHLAVFLMLLENELKHVDFAKVLKMALIHDLPELYAAMDAFVLPSHREGFPRTPMEASAMGVPCVVTDIRGCREAVEHERNGLLVPLGDVQSLALALIRVLSDSKAIFTESTKFFMSSLVSRNSSLSKNTKSLDRTENILS